MDKQPPSRAPLIIAIVLLLLPVLYVGSYFALVIPGGEVIVPNSVVLPFPHPVTRTYKLGGEWSETLYWPLEQIDRKLRPEAWPVRELLRLDSEVKSNNRSGILGEASR